VSSLTEDVGQRLNNKIRENSPEAVRQEPSVVLLKPSVIDGCSPDVYLEESRDVVSDNEQGNVQSLVAHCDVRVQLDNLVEAAPLGNTGEDDDSRVKNLVALEYVIRDGYLTISPDKEEDSLAELSNFFLEADLW